MSTTNAIEVRDLRKVYRRHGRRTQFATLKSALLSGGLLSQLRPEDTFEALRGVSFDVAVGQTFGIIGRNGSGKSTLLTLLAGIGKPTGGSLRVDGKVSALIELGAGFHPEIPGRENVFINGMMLGLTRREVAEHFDEIVRFAEIEKFIDAPVKTYSSGMYMRLGFSVAIHVNPDVLLVDEVLAVGDEAFTRKCLDKFAEFRQRGKTVLIVTHSLDLVPRFCNEAIWLDAGCIREQGDPQRVVDAYLMDVAETEERALKTADDLSTERVAAGAAAMVPPEQKEAAPEPAEDVPPDERPVEGRWGSREAEITDVSLLHDGRPAQVFVTGDAFEIQLRVKATRPLEDIVFGVGIFNAEGVWCFGTNTKIDGASGGALEGEGEVRFLIDRLDLVEGTYKLDVAVHRANGAPYDYHRQLHTIRVISKVKDVGVFRPPHRWEFSGGARVSGLQQG